MMAAIGAGFSLLIANLGEVSRHIEKDAFYLAMIWFIVSIILGLSAKYFATNARSLLVSLSLVDKQIKKRNKQKKARRQDNPEGSDATTSIFDPDDFRRQYTAAYSRLMLFGWKQVFEWAMRRIPSDELNIHSTRKLVRCTQLQSLFTLAQAIALLLSIHALCSGVRL